MVMSDLTASLVPLGVKPAEATALLLIAAHPVITQSDIGRTLGILRANMTPMAAGLVRRGLIAREPVDGRSQALRLTSRGEVLARKAQKIILDHEARLFGTLSPSARDRMLGQLRELWQRARTEDPALRPLIE